MKTYRRKPVEVQAIQYFYNDAIDSSKSPIFLELIQKGFAYINSDKHLVIPDLKGADIAYPGHWLMVNGDGNISVVSNKYFQANFEEA